MNGKIQNKDYSHIKKWFAVSDVHSYYTELIKALDEKGFDISDKSMGLILCGDAFDRGDDTIKVFDFLKEMRSQDRLIYILGNHEGLLFDCVQELLYGKTPGSHHFHNGTVKTVCMLCHQNEWIAYTPPPDIREMIKESTDPVLQFIKDNGRNYFELGNKIFVHSWIPCKVIGTDYTWSPKYEGIHPLWNVDPNSLDEEKSSIYNSEWYSARWGNPYKMWKEKLYPEDKCIVFGHFHTSYGHSRIDMKCKEWPQKNKPDWQSAFKPWIKENAIGIDSCVAYSGFINCLVFDEEGNLLNDDK